MVSPIASKILINVSLFLIIGVNLVSTVENSGLLARLYKKAAQQDRPLVLVLDNARHGKSKHEAKAHKHDIANLESYKDLGPLVYLYQLGQSQKKKQLAKKPKKFTKSLRSVYRYRSERQQNRDRLDERERREDDDSPALKNLLKLTKNLLRQKEDSCSGPKDECEKSPESSGGCDDVKDECAASAEEVSTKGVLYSPEDDGNKCKKCR